MRRILGGYPDSRCPDCGLAPEHCLCANLPSLATRIAPIFVQHPAEERKPTGSARLSCRILTSARRSTWDRTRPPTFAAGTLLLYPFPDAPPLTSADLAGKVEVAIPDGTWAQAARIANVLRRDPSVVPRALPAGLDRVWSLRDSGSDERLSSAQAAAEALEIGREHQAASVLREALMEASRRMRAMRGLVEPPPSGAL